MHILKGKSHVIKISIMLTLALAVHSPSTGLASDTIVTEDNKKASPTAEETLKADYPNLQFTSISQTAIEGLYEVVAGMNILYYAPKAHYLVIGEIFTKDGKDISADSRDKAIASLLDDIPLDKAVKIGKGKYKVIMFTDVDCPYCRKVEDYFKDKKDVTRYIFLTPLEELHPKSMAKSVHILCANNPAKVYLDTVSGKYDTDPPQTDYKSCDKAKVKAALAEYHSTANKLGAKGTPYLFVNGVVVRGADFAKIDELLGYDKKTAP